jgi:hypothetical protein
MSQGTVAAACPRCKSPLIDPGGLGWCKACGYCRSLAESEPKAIQEIPLETPKSPDATSGSVVSQKPWWTWVSLIGMGAIIAGTWIAAQSLRLTPLERAILTSADVLASVAILLITQFIAVIKIAPEESTLGFWDALIPLRLYGMIFKRLPRSGFAVCVAAWALTAIITVNVFIGGMGHWLTYLPENKDAKVKRVPTTQ